MIFPKFALVSQKPPPYSLFERPSRAEADVRVDRLTAVVEIVPQYGLGHPDNLLLFVQTTRRPSQRLRAVARFIRKTPKIVPLQGKNGFYAYPPIGGPFTIHNRDEVAELLESIASDWEREE